MGPSMSDDSLREILEEYLQLPGTRAALLVSDQGLTISSVLREDLAVASISALVIETVAAAQKFGVQVGAGYLDTMTIEYQDCSVMLAPFTPDVMLVLIAAPGCLSPVSRSPGAELR
jgi:predicted regulator of Ras-like GTPase activity (Roadblock/LC7/MglB family)